MLVIALTGGIGSGKTTVADLFASLDVPVVDTDIIARELVQAGSPALQEIRQHFDDQILGTDGSLDRDCLRKLIFSDPEKRKILESILHPLIRREAQQRIHKLQADYCIVVIPLLTETGQNEEYDRVLLIDCPEEKQIERVMKRNSLPEAEIRAIMAAQSGRSLRLQMADDVIENTGTIEQLHTRVLQLDKQYRQMARH